MIFALFHQHIQNLLSGLDTSKATGIDNIPAKVLKDSVAIIAKPLCYIINKCLVSGVFPDKWKIARVSPIHKGNAKDDPNNYRPISVLPVVAKIFEKSIYDQLYKYLADNDILSKFQSGFRPMHSTLTSLIQTTENWYKNIDDGLLNGVFSSRLE